MIPLRYLLTVTLMGFLSGCSSTPKAASATGHFLVSTVTTTGKVVGTTVTTTGKVAGTVATTTGTVAKAGVKGAASLVKTGMVTFKDVASGTVKQVPWVEGVKLYAASKTAQVDMYLKAFQIFRGAQVIKSDWSKIKSGTPEPELHAGDVIEIGHTLKKS